MSILTALEKVGKGIEHVIPWIEDGLKAAQIPLTFVDPLFVPILTAMEAALAAVPGGNQMSATQLQSLTTAITAAIAAGIAAGAVPKT